MVYRVIYKNKKRNWVQYTLDDYDAVDKALFNAYLDRIEAEKWKQKKQWYSYLRAKGIKGLSPLRRGRLKKRYATKSDFHMDNPRDVQEVKRFSWFILQWHNKSTPQKKVSPTSQQTLEEIIDKFYPKLKNNYEKYPGSFIIPRFRAPNYVTKEDFCEGMEDWAWEALHTHTSHPAFAFHVFYFNDFSEVDNEVFDLNHSWAKIDGILPSDVVKYEIFRLLEGYITYEDFFRTIELIPSIQNYLAINITHKLPSSKHFTSILRKIGVKPLEKLFQSLVDEARSLGLIKDRIHIWDGQFHETWLKHNKERRTGLDSFFGGTYNHGGKKVGIGVYQSTLMDWNGYCTIPIYTQCVEANKNENPVLRDTVTDAYKENNPIPKILLADRGPCGIETQEHIYHFGIRPIIPVTSNFTNDVYITPNKKHRFLIRYIKDIREEDLEKIYDIRTRIEEHYSLNDMVFRSARLHCSGKEMTKIEIILLNCLGVLIPLTAYKLGRPDLMWSPSEFRFLTIDPQEIVPTLFKEIQKFRWDERHPGKIKLKSGHGR